eukprot:UN02962
MFIASTTGDDFSKQTQRMTNLAGTLNELYDKYKELQQQYEMLRNFMEMYETFKPLIEAENPFDGKSVDDKILRQKANVILAGSEKIESTVLLLRQLQEHQGQLDVRPIDNIDKMKIR